jgi:large subunit ribosomal protein L29
MRDLKAEKIREMTEDEILTKIRELKEELFHLRFRNQMRQLQNPLLLREKKRDVARMNTILAEHRSGLRPLAGHAAAGTAAPAGAAPSEARTAAPAARSRTRAVAKKKTAKAKPKKAAAKSRPSASKAKAKSKPAAKRKAKKS